MRAYANARRAVLVVISLTFWAALSLAPLELAQVDEKHVLGQVSSYGFLDIGRNVMRDSHPPLYYWLAKAWWHIGHFDRPWAYRVLSVFIGLLALPFAFRVGLELTGARGGLFLLALLALNPFYIFQLVLIRMYSVVIAGGAMLTWIWLRLLRRPSQRQWLVWGVGHGLLAFAHYYSVLFTAGQGLIIVLRRPRGWRIGIAILFIFLVAFAAWFAMAVQAGSVDFTSRNLAAIPVRPLPGEVIFHFWANALVGPLADGRFAQAVGLAVGLMLGVLWLRTPRVALLPAWKDLGIATGLAFLGGVLLVLRWPFFGARYFAALLVPFMAWVLMGVLSRPYWPILLCLGLIGLAQMPLLVGRPDAGDTKEIRWISMARSSDPVLIQAWWHMLWPEYPNVRAYSWSDPKQRQAVVSGAPSFWFIGVSMYRGNWEGWLQQLRSTHLVDFHMEIDHPIRERQASVFHLVRRAQPVIWEDVDARWENGIQLKRIGWVRQEAEPGASFQVALQFTAWRPIDRRWTLFMHLVDGRGQLWANWDGEPNWPTDQWAPGQEIPLGWSVLVPLNVPAGSYRVQIGWYETGTPGFPRVPLEGAPGVDSLPLGVITVRPQELPSRIGTVREGPVELIPPVLRMIEGPQGWRLEVRTQWRSLEGASTAGWRVYLKAQGAVIELQRAIPIPEAWVQGPGWLSELWISPPLSGGRPALGWVEIAYNDRLVSRRPVWIFPNDVRWHYGWLFFNRYDR
ncbi:glycosyltransferase family 39 protein [Thermoflexus sp.]|uniref:glycosyltransferase family 39 protein n=1 Tax=Thermoflexus sp. TaxID=1969742 RepID=UPI0035E4436A